MEDEEAINYKVRGHSGGPVVTVLELNPDELISYPADAYSFLCKNCV